MSTRIGIVMDPVQGINPQKDTTLALMLAAQNRGAALYYMVMDGLYVEDGKSFAIAQKIRVFDDPDKWFELDAPERIALGTLDIILMRKDPPVDKRFIHACYMLEQAAREGVYVSNDPTALVSLNEKIFATHFPALCPPTVISSDKGVLRDFLDRHGKIILKPLDSMGGEGIFMVESRDVNFEVIWEVQTKRGTYPIIAQAFLPAIAEGDKRVVVISGQPFEHVLVRTPKEGSIRGNLAAGGGFSVRPINDTEKNIALTVGKVLMERGIVFSGIDIIGDRLIEINITSPTGLPQISKACGQNVADLVLSAILQGAGGGGAGFLATP